MATSKSTSCASNAGPSTQANCALPPTITRQPPHMPVPSTISGSIDTSVFTLGARVVSATARIMAIGPIATTRSGPARAFAGDEAFELLRDEALEAGRAVVGADREVVAQRLQLVGEDQQVLVARADDRRRLLAGGLQLAHQAQQHGRAEAAADAADMRAGRHLDRAAQRADHVEQVVARFQRAHQGGGGADLLHDDGDRAGARGRSRRW